VNFLPLYFWTSKVALHCQGVSGGKGVAFSIAKHETEIKTLFDQELACLDSNPCAACYELCDLGQMLYLSVSQFPCCQNEGPHSSFLCGLVREFSVFMCIRQ
jgi:hypothetical protein